MSEHIEAVVRLFVRKDKQERLLSLARKQSRWADFRHDLLHDTRNLEPTALTPVDRATTQPMMRLLGAAAAERAYCISGSLKLDDREMGLDEALRIAVGIEEDTLVFCIGSRSAYYENHEGERYLLRRR